jgi:hypothetical protein
MNENETRRLRRNARLAAAVVLALMIVCAALMVTQRAQAADQQRPVYPLPTCSHVDQAYCAAVLVNSWDGRQVVHQLTPVLTCSTRRVDQLQERLDRKNRKLHQLRDRVARLRDRLAAR